MRKLPNRIPETAELRVVVLRDLVADKEVIPVQQKRTLKNNYQNKNKKKNTPEQIKQNIPEKQNKQSPGKPKKQGRPRSLKEEWYWRKKDGGDQDF